MNPEDSFLPIVMALLQGATDPLTIWMDQKHPLTEGLAESMQPMRVAFEQDPRIEVVIRSCYPDPRSLVN